MSSIFETIEALAGQLAGLRPQIVEKAKENIEDQPDVAVDLASVLVAIDKMQAARFLIGEAIEHLPEMLGPLFLTGSSSDEPAPSKKRGKGGRKLGVRKAKAGQKHGGRRATKKVGKGGAAKKTSTKRGGRKPKVATSDGEPNPSSEASTSAAPKPIQRGSLDDAKREAIAEELRAGASYEEVKGKWKITGQMIRSIKRQYSIT